MDFKNHEAFTLQANYLSIFVVELKYMIKNTKLTLRELTANR